MSVEAKSKEEFLNAAVAMIAARPEAHILLIIDSDRGLEMLQTKESLIWSFGVLAASEKLLDERYRAAMDAEGSRRMEAHADREIDVAINGKERSN